MALHTAGAPVLVCALVCMGHKRHIADQGILRLEWCLCWQCISHSVSLSSLLLTWTIHDYLVQWFATLIIHLSQCALWIFSSSIDPTYPQTIQGHFSPSHLSHLCMPPLRGCGGVSHPHTNSTQLHACANVVVKSWILVLCPRLTYGVKYIPLVWSLSGWDCIM